MAEEQKAISSHLDEYYHVFKNGTTARLNVSPWTRQTVADGYWQNNNNIRPLSARDVYLAECIENLSANQIVYNAGEGIKIEMTDPTSSRDFNQYTISVDDDEYKEKVYEFSEEGFDVSTETDVGKVTYNVDLKYDGTTIKWDDTKGLYCDLTGVIATSYSAKNIVEKKQYDYSYEMSNLNVQFTSTISNTMLGENGIDPDVGTIVFVG